MTQVLKFGCRQIASNRDAALAEMERANRYYNALAEIGRTEASNRRALMNEHVEHLGDMVLADELLQHGEGGIEHHRDAIRSMRRKESVKRAAPPKKARPTKQVDDALERWAVEELLRWQKELRAAMRPKRAEFQAMLEAGDAEYRRRTGKPPRAKREPGEKRLKPPREAAKDFHAQGRLNRMTLEAMLAEPEWHPAWKADAANRAGAEEMRRLMRKESHLAHGTYTAAELAVKAATKPPKPRRDGKPRRWKERPARSSKWFRKMGWQLLKRPTWAAIMQGACTDLRVLSTMSARTPSLMGKSGRRNPQNHGPVEAERQRRDAERRAEHGSNRDRMRYARVSIRVRSERPRDSARWVDVDVVIHRPVPPDAVVTWVYLVPHGERRLPGGRIEPERYSLQLTVETREPLIARAPGRGETTLRLGWAKHHTGGLRVATLDDGSEVVLPEKVATQIAMSEALRGAGDRHFDDARAAAIVWRDAGLLPDWAVEQMRTAANWRGHGRLARVAERLLSETPLPVPLPVLWGRWKEVRAALRAAHGNAAGDLYTSDRDGFFEWLGAQGVTERQHQLAVWLEWWRRKDRHLKTMEEDIGAKARAHRKDFYRCVAAKLATTYERVTIARLDLARAALRDMPEETPKELHQAARHQRTIVAPHELKEALRAALGGDKGGRYCEQDGDSPDPGTARDAQAEQENSPVGVLDTAAAE